jgi:FkbM family methyltransferase
VAVEPQPDFARLLRRLFAAAPNVEVMEAAAGGAAGRASLLISERTPTVTTIATAWHEARAKEPDFSHVQWNPPIEIPTTTLDLMIERFGTPAFVKIDVEGAEPVVLAGLSRPVRAMSFEYLPRALEYARVCVERLATLGAYRYNWSPGESYRLAETRWMNGDELCAALETATAQRRPGDVYAQLGAD